MMSMSGTNGTTTTDGSIESFQKPLFQTFGMFVGMAFGLAMHWVCVQYSIPFPGYDHGGGGGVSSSRSGVLPTETTSLVTGGSSTAAAVEQTKKVEGIPTSMYFLLAIPAAFDLGATALW
jgi:hypothetical protein